MVLVSSNPLSTTLQLQTPAGLIVPGVSFAKVAEQTAPAGRLIRQAMSFNALLGPSQHLAVDVQTLKATVRRHFAWEEFVFRLSRTLADLRQSGPDAVPRRALTDAALADTWAAEIVNLPALLAYLTTAGRVPLAVSEQGLLALLVDALAEPWDTAPEPLPQMPAYRRFARCAMLASELLDIRDPRDGVLTLFAPDALLGLGRIREFDLPQCALVRATELYVELLPQLFPDAERLFSRKRGMPIAEWIRGTVALATMAFENVKPGSSFSTRIDFRQPDTRPAAQRSRRVAEELSRSRDEFRQEFARLFAQAVNPGLAFRPLRESPLLRLDKDLYIGLHADFLLAAADESVFFSMVDALGPAGSSKGALFAAVGTAFEQYVTRVLARCAAASCTQPVRVREAPGRNRCDFAWRVGDDLLLLDAKRFGLASNLLMGDLALSQRMLSDVGKAVEQFAETANDIARHGMESVIPEFAGWSPRRVFAAAVSHRPMYLWFGAADQIASNTNLPRPWKDLFAARLLVWSISELELLEAALPTLPLGRLFDDVCRDDPRTFLDLRAYLQEIGWKGPSASDYYPRRARQILESED
jgi:hypothetical protein